MSNAIKDLAKTSGKPPMLFSLCQWGRVSPSPCSTMRSSPCCSYNHGCGQGSWANPGGYVAALYINPYIHHLYRLQMILARTGTHSLELLISIAFFWSTLLLLMFPQELVPCLGVRFLWAQRFRYGMLSLLRRSLLVTESLSARDVG